MLVVLVEQSILFVRKLQQLDLVHAEHPLPICQNLVLPISDQLISEHFVELLLALSVV